MKFLRLVALLLACVALAGCTATALPDPTPAPSTESSTESTAEATLPPLGFTPDLVLVRDFDGTTCTINLHVLDNANHADEVAAARAFLAAGDWSGTEVTLEGLTEFQLEDSREQGRSDAELLASELQGRVHDDMVAAGHTGTWLSTEGRTVCA